MTKFEWTIISGFVFCTFMGLVFSCRKDVTEFRSEESQTSINRTNEIPGQYIVRLKTDAVNFTKVKGIRSKSIFVKVFKGFVAELSQEQITQLKKDDNVLSIEQDGIMQNCEVEPHVKRVLATQNSYAAIDGNDNPADVDIAIIDTGIDPANTDLNVIDRVVFLSLNNGAGQHFHATHVAGIAAGKDNSDGITGICPGARLWDMRVLGSDGSGAWSDLIKACEYVIDHPAIDVVNLSLGGAPYDNTAIHEAFKAVVNSGVVVIAAAGNSNMDVYGADKRPGNPSLPIGSNDFVPASFSEVMTVSAMGDADGIAGGLGANLSYCADDQFASFTNYSSYDDGNNPVFSPGGKIDIACPGVDVLSWGLNMQKVKASGTSMAAPVAAGLVALYILEHGRATDANGVYKIRQAIVDAAQPQFQWRNAGSTLDKDDLNEGLGQAEFTSKVDRPTITINSPTDKQLILYGTTTTLSAITNGISVDWFTSITGKIGTGSTINTILPIGDYTIKALSFNSSGNAAAAYVNVLVYPNTPLPTPEIVGLTKALGAGFSDVIKVVWNTSGYAQYYQLEASYSKNGNNNWTAWQIIARQAPTNNIYDYAYTKRGSYRFRIIAINPFVQSDYSPIVKIRI